MKNIILLIALCLSIHVTAQDQIITQDVLVNKTWTMSGVKGKVIEKKYSKSEIEFYYNGKSMGVFDYYLSNKIDSVFNKSKVGKISSGKYIISKYKGAASNNFSILEVISHTSKEHILKNENQNLIKYELK